MNEGTSRIFIICCTMVLVVLVLAMSKSCETQRDRRAECMKQGHSAVECKEAFER